MGGSLTGRTRHGEGSCCRPSSDYSTPLQTQTHLQKGHLLTIPELRAHKTQTPQSDAEDREAGRPPRPSCGSTGDRGGEAATCFVGGLWNHGGGGEGGANLPSGIVGLRRKPCGRVSSAWEARRLRTWEQLRPLLVPLLQEGVRGTNQRYTRNLLGTGWPSPNWPFPKAPRDEGLYFPFKSFVSPKPVWLSG